MKQMLIKEKRNRKNKEEQKDNQRSNNMSLERDQVFLKGFKTLFLELIHIDKKMLLILLTQ